MTELPDAEDTGRAARRARRSAHPKPQLQTRHTEGAVLLPDRFALLDRMPGGCIVAEIGVAFGDFTAEILARARPRRLHLIDSWESDRYASGLEQVRMRFAREIAAGTVQIDRGFSTEVLARFDQGYFDWVYFDSDHSYETTAAELALCDRVVARDGLIAGHDFCTGNIIAPVVYGVIPAVHEFCLTRGWRYDAVTLESHGHFSFCLRRLDPAPGRIEQCAGRA